MKAIDMINWVGSKKLLRPFGVVIHRVLRRLPLIRLLDLSGRPLGGPIYGACLALFSGTTVKENLTSGVTMFRSVEKFVTAFKPDLCLCAFPDLSAEAEACGCPVRMPENALPSVTAHPVQTLEDLKGLPVPDPETVGRLPVFIQATRLFSERFALLSIAPSTGPFTLAAELMGAETISRNIFKNPRLVHALMEFSVEMHRRYNLSLVRAGAEIIALGEPTASLLSPKAFEKFVYPCLKRLISAVPRQVLLHICGQAPMRK